MTRQTMSADEAEARALDIYERLKPTLEPQNIGKYIVIDVETGDYELDTDGDAASDRAYRKRPEGIRFGMRVGFPAWGRIGSGRLHA